MQRLRLEVEDFVTLATIVLYVIIAIFEDFIGFRNNIQAKQAWSGLATLTAIVTIIYVLFALLTIWYGRLITISPYRGVDTRKMEIVIINVLLAIFTGYHTFVSFQRIFPNLTENKILFRMHSISTLSIALLFLKCVFIHMDYIIENSKEEIYVSSIECSLLTTNNDEGDIDDQYLEDIFL
ncbi:hypothetical protein CsatB_012893 [Cannabis sativa]